MTVALWAADGSVPASGPDATVLTATTLAEALRSSGEPDLVHDSGLWLAHNHRLASWAYARSIPRVVSVRGMLQPWALRHKHFKKLLAWQLYQKRDLRRACLLHATAPDEAATLHRLVHDTAVCTIPNGVDVPPLRQPSGRRQGGLRNALFLGRLYPVKGLPMLVEAWGRARPKGWRLTIAGPDEAGHRAEVERAVASRGLQSAIEFIGAVDGTQKQAAFESAEILVLPSHSESFGMVVAEALAHSVPVIATDATPWSDLDRRGCGWCVPAAVDGLAGALAEACVMDAVTLMQKGAAGRRWMESDFSWDAIARRFIAAYELARNGAPAIVDHERARAYSRH